MESLNWLHTSEVALEALTPAMRQVVEAKRAHPDALIFFRLGDFYELFFEDALVVAPLLDMVLTSRNKNDPRPIPMCGFPHFALDAQLERLVGAGHRIAVVDQLEDARKARGLVRRGVTRVITPGVVLETEALPGRRANYLVAVVGAGRGGLAVAVAEVSTGELRCAELPHVGALDALLCRYEARELLVEAGLHGTLAGVAIAAAATVTQRALEAGAARRRGSEAAVALLRAYLAEVRPQALGLLGVARPLEDVPALRLERETAIHLELLRTARTGRVEGSLLHAVDRTCSAAGGRLLRSLLLAPLADAAAIVERHDAVAALVDATSAREAGREALRVSADIARITGRLAAGLAVPRELAALRDTLTSLPPLASVLAAPAQRSDRLAAIAAALGDGAAACAELWRTLADEPRNQLADGGVIRPGRCARLDALVAFGDDGEHWVARYQEELRRSTGITSLKVRHHRMNGWGIEIARSRGDRVPDGMCRVQTLKHVERYTTESLMEFDARAQTAVADRIARETELFEELCTTLAADAEALRRVGAALAELDVHAGFATLALERGHVRPMLTPEPVLMLRQARHPVVEAALPHGAFVANDLTLRYDGVRLLLLTGPNMAGKSTLMRQVALCCLLAQAGGFVPAREATLPVLDALMTRIGASDDISDGASTFMVEMRETAAILAGATPRSLVLLDEVGRGTSTQDGLAIARAVVEHLHDQTGALCLFATHYHELTDLAATLAHLDNAHVAVEEVDGEVVFVHRLAAGPTSRSHGIAVARLAGLPAQVLDRAQVLLTQAESASAAPGASGRGRRRDASQFDLFGTAAVAAPPPAAASAEAMAAQALVRELADIDVDDLSPRAAHARLATLVVRAGQLRETGRG